MAEPVRPPGSFDELAARLTSGHRTIGELVYEVIKEAIVGGTFAPGERLRQEALASALSVSRPPVRTALVQLDAEGLVSFHPHRGAVVRSLTPEQVTEIFRIRRVLEPLALRRSMDTMTPQRRSRQRQLAQEVDAQSDAGGFAEASLRFYREIYDAENNPQLVEIIEELRSRVARYLVGWHAHGDQTRQHTELIRRIEEGNPDRAEEALLDHLQLVQKNVETVLGTKGPGQPTAAAKL